MDSIGGEVDDEINATAEVRAASVVVDVVAAVIVVVVVVFLGVINIESYWLFSG